MTIKDMSRSVCTCPLKGLTMKVSENSSNGNNCSDSNRRIIIFDIYIYGYDGSFYARILTLIIKLLDLPSETFKGVFVDGVYLIIVK